MLGTPSKADGPHGPGEREVDSARCLRLKFCHRELACHETVPDQTHSVCHTFDFRHHVGGQPDGRATALPLGQEIPELLLQHRVEAAGRLVKDQQLRIPHECQDQPDLPTIPGAQIAERSRRIKPKTFD